jgi:threonine/homoserine/homoserine lactone efflux protein
VIPHNFAAFLILTALVSLAPGPNTMFIMSQAGLRGHRAGILAGLGIETANVVYFALVALGLSTVVAANAMAFDIIKYVGAAYLLVIGVWAFYRSFDKSHERPNAPSAMPPPSRVGRTAYGAGLLIALGNPKTIIWFLALLPQFIDPARHVLWQTVTICVVGTVVDLLAQAVYVFAGGALGALLQRPRVRRWFERGLGTVFVGLAALAAFYKRAA